MQCVVWINAGHERCSHERFNPKTPMKTGIKRYPLQSILPSSYSLTGRKLIGHFSICLAALAAFWASRATADSFSFSTGDPDGKIAPGARPASPAKIETEKA